MATSGATGGTRNACKRGSETTSSYRGSKTSTVIPATRKPPRRTVRDSGAVPSCAIFRFSSHLRSNTAAQANGRAATETEVGTAARSLAVSEHSFLRPQANGCELWPFIGLLRFGLFVLEIHSASLHAVLSDFRNCRILPPPHWHC